MAKRSRSLTEKAIAKRWKSGYGQGKGSDYKPWLTIQDVPSKGQVNRPLGWKTGRVHHFMSLNELHYFYLLEWSPRVMDIREQYPLWPPEETQNIANALGVQHPAPPGTDVMVMTSDFFIVLNDGCVVVRTVKAASELSNERTVQKLDIEREYWQRRGIHWGIIVAEDLPIALVENIKWLHPHITLEGFNIDVESVPAIARYLTGEVRVTQDALANVARRCDDDLCLQPGSCLTLARHLLATRQWHVDMSIRINPTHCLKLLQPGED